MQFLQKIYLFAQGLLYSVCFTIVWVSRCPHAQRGSLRGTSLLWVLSGHLDKCGRRIRQQSGTRRTRRGFGEIDLRSTGDAQDLAASVQPSRGRRIDASHLKYGSSRFTFKTLTMPWPYLFGSNAATQNLTVIAPPSGMLSPAFCLLAWNFDQIVIGYF